MNFAIILNALIYIGLACGIVYFIFQRRKEKKEENKKDYRDY